MAYIEDKEVVEHMRELLLKGARMLDEHCPRCGTPLFLIKETGLKYCPKCRVYIATEEELKLKGIDKTKAKIFDFEEYWKQKESESEKIEDTNQATVATPEKKENKEETTSELIQKEELAHVFDDMLITILEKIMLKIEEKEFTLSELLELLKELVKIRRELEST